MKSGMKIIAASVLLIFSIYGSASAISLGNNITIFDGVDGSGDWFGYHEDDEVEPGSETGQSWDLEGFFLNGHILTMVGGYDFVNGYSGVTSGDIFIDVDGDVIFGGSAAGLDNLSGGGNKLITNAENEYVTYGYDYVLDIDFGTMRYDVYGIDDDTELLSVSYRQNDGSNAWRYSTGGELISQNNSFDYFAGLNSSEVGGLTGDSHNAVSVDLGFLDHGTTFTSHFTMECGNDNLIGQAALAPEPATMALFGIGLIGLAGIGRKKLGKVKP